MIPHDRLYYYLLFRGLAPKDASDPEKSLSFICGKFGLQPFYGSKALKKRVLKSFREALNRGEELTKEKVVVLALSTVSPEFRYETSVEKTIHLARSKGFYESQYWRNIRLQALERNTRGCEACGRTVADGVQLHVDHILPRSTYPEFALTLNNLQILCKDCNFGKGNVHTTNFRRRNDSHTPNEDNSSGA